MHFLTSRVGTIAALVEEGERLDKGNHYEIWLFLKWEEGSRSEVSRRLTLGEQIKSGKLITGDGLMRSRVRVRKTGQGMK